MHCEPSQIHLPALLFCSHVVWSEHKLQWLGLQLSALTDTGNIKHTQIDKTLSKGKYQFSDNTGVIVLDIDDEVMGNMQILSEDIVEIHGEVDKGWFSTEIDVEEIMKK